MTKNCGPLVLGIDLEGVNQNLDKGVNLEVDRVTELGAVLWDWHLKGPVGFFSILIDEEDRLSIDDELEELTGISNKMLQNYGARGEGICQLLDLFSKNFLNLADYVMAHSGRDYDYIMLKGLYERHGRTMPEKLWIDSSTDIEYPAKMKKRSMAMLEHQHSFINPFPHRAITDVLSMFKIAINYPLDKMIPLAKSPVVKLVAELIPPNWKSDSEVEEFNKIKNKVAKAGFRWNPREKTWSKRVHQVLMDRGAISFDFKTSLVKTLPAGASFRD